jgi:iron complex transport system substrate-binding protein
MNRLWAVALILYLGALGDTWAAPIVVTDDVERSVRLNGPATRIVTLEPFLTELVFAVGAGSQLVGIAKGSNFPFETFAIPKVRGVSGFLDEQGAALKPDLVIASIDGINPDEVDRISAMGAAVFVAYARRLDHVPRLLRTFGILTGKGGESAASEYETRIEQIRQANRGKSKIPVMVEIQHRPITTVSASHFLNDALQVCAAENVFAAQVAVTPAVTWEQVYKRNPRAVVGFGSASSVDEFNGNWAMCRQLDAVREGRLLFLDTDVVQHPTTRTPDHVARLCRLLDTVRP